MSPLLLLLIQRCLRMAHVNEAVGVESYRLPGDLARVMNIIFFFGRPTGTFCVSALSVQSPESVVEPFNCARSCRLMEALSIRRPCRIFIFALIPSFYPTGERQDFRDRRRSVAPGEAAFTAQIRRKAAGFTA